MVVYIEYALLENFILDGVLLWLALSTVRIPVKIKRILFSASVGATFAVLYPLLVLPDFLASVLKLSAGALLCLLAVGSLKNGKAWGRYALSCLSFYAYTFAFGGAILALSDATTGEKVPVLFVAVGFVVLTALSVYFVKKLYAKKTEHRYVYDCVLAKGGKRVTCSGFLDSGNRACKDGVAVCFVSWELAFALWGESALEGKIPPDRLEIQTLGGRKSVPLYFGELSVENCGKTVRTKVYFAPSANIVGREYQVILNARTFEDG